MKTVLVANGVRGFFKEWHSVGNTPLAGSQNIDFRLGNWLKTSIGSECTYTLLNGKPGQWHMLRIEQGSGGPFAINWINVDWGDMGPPDHLHTLTEGDWTLCAFYYDSDGKWSGSHNIAFDTPWL